MNGEVMTAIQKRRCEKKKNTLIFAPYAHKPPKEKGDKEKVTQFLCLFYFLVSWEVVNHKTFRMVSRQGTHAKQIQYWIGPSSNNPPQNSQVVHSLCCSPGIMAHTNESMSTHLTTPDFSKSPIRIRESHGSQWLNHMFFMKILQRSLNSEIGIAGSPSPSSCCDISHMDASPAYGKQSVRGTASRPASGGPSFPAVSSISQHSCA